MDELHIGSNEFVEKNNVPPRCEAHYPKFHNCPSRRSTMCLPLSSAEECLRTARTTKWNSPCGPVERPGNVCVCVCHRVGKMGRWVGQCAVLGFAVGGFVSALARNVFCTCAKLSLTFLIRSHGIRACHPKYFKTNVFKLSPQAHYSLRGIAL